MYVLRILFSKLFFLTNSCFAVSHVPMFYLQFMFKLLKAKQANSCTCVYTRALMHMPISTNLDIHTIPQFQFLSPFNCVLYSKLPRYSVETGPLPNLVVILLFLITNTTCVF